MIETHCVTHRLVVYLFAIIVAKLQVPVMYAIFVLDLEILERKTVETLVV